MLYHSHPTYKNKIEDFIALVANKELDAMEHHHFFFSDFRDGIKPDT